MTHANQTNELLTNLRVTGPYAERLGFSADSSANQEIAVLMAHLNFLRLVYFERDVLGTIEVESYIKWAKEWLAPWITNVDFRLKAWREFRRTADVAGQEFVGWIAPHLPD